MFFRCICRLFKRKGIVIEINCVIYDPINTLIDEISLPFIKIGIMYKLQEVELY